MTPAARITAVVAVVAVGTLAAVLSIGGPAVSLDQAQRDGLFVAGVRIQALVTDAGVAFFAVQRDGGAVQLERSPCARWSPDRACLKTDGGELAMEDVVQPGEWVGDCASSVCTLK